MKSEKGSITLVVGTTLIFIILLLETLYTTAYIKSRSQISELSEFKNAYDGDMKELYLERLSDEMVNNTIATNSINTENLGTTNETNTNSTNTTNEVNDTITNTTENTNSTETTNTSEVTNEAIITNTAESTNNTGTT